MRDAVFPGIIAASDADAVRGVVYLDVDEASLARLDVFEDDFYERQALWIECDDGQRRQADAYVVPPTIERCSPTSSGTATNSSPAADWTNSSAASPASPAWRKE